MDSNEKKKKKKKKEEKKERKKKEEEEEEAIVSSISFVGILRISFFFLVNYFSSFLILALTFNISSIL
jgi:hypothetical protein